MKKSVFILAALAIATTSCVSKKKFVALEDNYNQTQSALTKSNYEKEQLESKFAEIQSRVSAYNKKISALADENTSLGIENANKLDLLPGSMVMSKANKERLNSTLAGMDPNVVSGARTLKDSMNLAVGQSIVNVMKRDDQDIDSSDVDVKIDETVVMITISDKLLFNSGSFRVNSKAYGLLGKLSDVINSEPSMDVMVEGHTDSRTIKTEVLEDNWDLSVKRATSITRLLQNKYKVNPEQLIASGRSSYMPVVDNDTKENRARNRRTRIVILPNLDKFFSLMASN